MGFWYRAHWDILEAGFGVHICAAAANTEQQNLRQIRSEQKGWVGRERRVEVLEVRGLVAEVSDSRSATQQGPGLAGRGERELGSH